MTAHCLAAFVGIRRLGTLPSLPDQPAARGAATRRHRRHPCRVEAQRLRPDASARAREHGRTRLAARRRNHLIGNADAHGKNFSFFVTTAGLRLALAYDLVCVAAYPSLEQESAMAIGEQFDPAAVTAPDWDAMAIDCVLDQRLVRRELAAMKARVVSALQAMTASVEIAPEFADDGIGRRVSDVVTRRSST